MDITKAKKLFKHLEKLYLDSDAYQEYQKMLGHRFAIYTDIVNIVFVFLGLRPMCLIENMQDSVAKILLSLKDYDKNLLVIPYSDTVDDPEITKIVRSFHFINKKVVKDKGYSKELNSLLNKKWDAITLGKLLGYICPNDIFANADKYTKLDNNLRSRYVLTYNVHGKDNNIIDIGKQTHLYASVCYNNKKKDYFYKDGIQRLKLYQKTIKQITDTLHIGFTFADEII